MCEAFMKKLEINQMNAHIAHKVIPNVPKQIHKRRTWPNSHDNSHTTTKKPQ